MDSFVAGWSRVLRRTTCPHLSGYTGCWLEVPSTTESFLGFWNSAKHVLRYRKKTRTIGSTYSKSSKKQAIFGYTDSDFAGDKTDRKSTSGYVFILSCGAMTWSSKKPSIVANSGQEAVLRKWENMNQL